MRIRCKPWAKPELEACPFYLKDPAAFRGNWQSAFPSQKPLRIELGCGKGGFIAQEAPANPDYHYLAMDIKNEMLVLAKRKLEAAYQELGTEPDSVRIFICNIMQFSNYFAPEDAIDRIYINFCNPWPKSKHKKRRLTHPRQLMQYRAVLKGEIWFKTDDRSHWNISGNADLTFCSKPMTCIRNPIFAVTQLSMKKCLKKWERPLNF